MKNNIKKVLFLLSSSQKRNISIIAFLLLIGVLFEMAGLGVLFPAFTVIIKNDITTEYPFLKPVLEKIGNPSHRQLVFAGMSLLVIVYTIKSLYLYFLYRKQFRFSTKLSMDIGQKLFRGYLKHDYAFHLERNSAILMRNIQMEVTNFNVVTQSIMVVTTELIIVLGAFFLLISVEPIGALVVTFFLGISAFGFQLLTKKKVFKWGKERQNIEGAINKHLIQGLGGIKEVKLMGRQQYFIEQFEFEIRNKAKIMANIATIQQVPRLYLELMAMIGLSGLVIMMILQGKELNELLPVLGVFMGASFRMIPSTSRIMGGLQIIKYGQPSLDLFYLEFKMIKDREFKETAAQVNQNLSFNEELSLKNLSFKYSTAHNNALHNISLSIKKDEFVGFVGRSGSGKSTIIDVILGLLKPTEGVVEVDGVNIETGMQTWQKFIGYVPQTVYLTDDSLRRNIALGIDDKKIDERAVLKAIKAAQLDEFVSSNPEGLNMIIGERGVRLSGGQKQRIGIARALYHDPLVLVMDEATSSLDTNTEAGVMQAVKALQGSKTIIVVAHRISTVENCDRLFRLEAGKIIEEGKPFDVLKKKT